VLRWERGDYWEGRTRVACEVSPGARRRIWHGWKHGGARGAEGAGEGYDTGSSGKGLLLVVEEERKPVVYMRVQFLDPRWYSKFPCCGWSRQYLRLTTPKNQYTISPVIASTPKPDPHTNSQLFNRPIEPPPPPSPAKRP